MDALRNAASSFTSGSSDAANAGQQTQQGGGGLMDTFNNAAGGGAAGEAKGTSLVYIIPLLGTACRGREGRQGGRDGRERAVRGRIVLTFGRPFIFGSSMGTEDYLDKGIDFAQERFMGAGDQSNESAVEQAKDEALSDGIRGYYKACPPVLLYDASGGENE
jgi:hypothetical protein